MPWVKQAICKGCTACVAKCPAVAISIQENLKALIHEDRCIYCGTCLDACPRGAVRPDKERLQLKLKENMRKIAAGMRHKSGLAGRERTARCMVDHYETQGRLAEATLRTLAAFYGRSASPAKPQKSAIKK